MYERSVGKYYVIHEMRKMCACELFYFVSFIFTVHTVKGVTSFPLFYGGKNL